MPQHVHTFPPPSLLRRQLVPVASFHAPLIYALLAVLSRRTFPPPRTLGMVEPGYRDAPAADEPVAFVYVKVGCQASSGRLTAEWRACAGRLACLWRNSHRCSLLPARPTVLPGPLSLERLASCFPAPIPGSLEKRLESGFCFAGSLRRRRSASRPRCWMPSRSSRQ